MSTVNIPIKLYGKTAAELALDNAIYEERQLIFETDTFKVKFTNGVLAYNALPYIGVSAVERALISILVTNGDGTLFLSNDGTYRVSGGGGGGSSTWGGITGTLANQTDLMAALNGKQASLGFTPENVTNKSIDGTLATNSDTKYPSEKAVRTFAEAKKTEANTYADTKVEDALVNGVTNKAPSQNIVFDQLALKQNALGYTAEDSAQKGVAGGYASLDGTGKVPSAQLPSFVDDVIEAANFAALPGTGETGKIYVTLDNNKTYRWSGSAYVEISASPGSTDSVTEGSVNLYFTAARVLATVLTGLSLVTGTPITASDTALVALGKLQKQITDLSATVGGIVSATLANIASAFHGATSKTPVDADEVAGMNSAASFAGVRYTWTNIKAFLKTYFDTLYLTSSNIDDTAYNESTWNGVTGNTASKNALRDEFENRLAKSVYQKTLYYLLSNWSIMPDSSGNTFLEPASIKQTNDRYNSVRILEKDSSTKTGIGLTFIVPSDFVSSPSIGIVWGSNATSGNNVVFDCDYTCGSLSGTTLDPSADEENLTVTTADSTTSQMSVISEMAITAANIGASQLFQCNISRDGANGSDTLASDIYIVAIYFKYNNY